MKVFRILDLEDFEKMFSAYQRHQVRPCPPGLLGCDYLDPLNPNLSLSLPPFLPSFHVC